MAAACNGVHPRTSLKSSAALRMIRMIMMKVNVDGDDDDDDDVDDDMMIC